MKRLNKLLISLLPYNLEKEKLVLLKNNYSVKEIISLLKKYNCNNVDDRINSILNYNISFIDENTYPKNLLKALVPPFRILSTKDFPKNDRIKFSTLSNQIIYRDINESIYTFGLSIGVNGGELITIGEGYFCNLIEKAMRNTEATCYNLLPRGFNGIEKYSTQLSFFEPFEKSNYLHNVQSYEIYPYLCDFLVVFQCAREDLCNKSIDAALDGGIKTFVHERCVVNRKGCEKTLELFNQGCSMISSFSQLASEEHILYGYNVKKINNN